MTLADAVVKFVGESTIKRAKIYQYFKRVPEWKIDCALQIAISLKKLNIHGRNNFMDDEFSRGRS